MGKNKSKLIRVKDATFEKLTKLGRWNDTMDTIITKLIEPALPHKER